MTPEEKAIQSLQCSWYNVNLDYHTLRTAIDNALPYVDGYVKGLLERAVEQVDNDRQRLSRQLQTLQPMEVVE